MRVDASQPPVEGRYLARLCFNRWGWKRPSGDAWRSEKGSFARDHKYGHEEWLLDFSTLIEGWKYGSIEIGQPRKRLAGKPVEVSLYTIRHDRARVLVGRISPCFVLTRAEAAHAIDVFRARGWLDRMIEEVEAVEGRLDVLRRGEPTEIVTVRFRPEAYQPVAGILAEQGSWIAARPRYQLMSIPDEVRALWRLYPDEGVSARRTEPSERPAGEPGPIVYRHNEIQNRLAALLKARYATVRMEAGNVDIRVEDPALHALIEVKATTDPRLAVREALGQVLEYALFGSSAGASMPRLFVAAPGEPTSAVEEYLETLRERFGLPIEYVEANPDMLALPPALAPGYGAEPKGRARTW